MINLGVNLNKVLVCPSGLRYLFDPTKGVREVI